ncbi:pentapeptide repeat-containing protein [Aerosakkonema sp. BLCC-F183]|uniref:pentapeptide repeat-containing protein n=1 Tax=Aerosakkonema sp. BLCC-F183 TaxID=3342834 RepID=UPI0035BB0174
MTVDEALEIVETALDYQGLNKVQELVFRQSWKGESYAEIAKSSGYNSDYIKAAGYELWKLLSKALGEKVKKDNIKPVLKRYLRQNKVNSQRNLTIEVNLSGANLSGANLNGARVVANFIETDLSQAVSPKAIMLDDNTELDEEEQKQENQADSEEQIYYWNDWQFRSHSEVKIAEALDRTNVLFFPNTKARLITGEGRQSQAANFLIFHQGKWGILKVSNPDITNDEESDRTFRSHGICIIQNYDTTRCDDEPERVVQEFLELMNQS